MSGEAERMVAVEIIQGGIRAYLSRREMAEGGGEAARSAPAGGMSAGAALELVQATIRAIIVKQQCGAENTSAAAIQASTLQASVMGASAEEDAAATKIQASFRGHQTRQEIKMAEEEAAATKIQAGFRGHQARKELKKA